MNPRSEQPDIDFEAEVEAEAEELRFPKRRNRVWSSSATPSVIPRLGACVEARVDNDVTYRHIRVDYRVRSRLLEENPESR